MQTVSLFRHLPNVLILPPVTLQLSVADSAAYTRKRSINRGCSSASWARLIDMPVPRTFLRKMNWLWRWHLTHSSVRHAATCQLLRLIPGNAGLLHAIITGNVTGWHCKKTLAVTPGKQLQRGPKREQAYHYYYYYYYHYHHHYPVSQKRCHYNLVHNFVKRRPIFKKITVRLIDSELNL